MSESTTEPSQWRGRLRRGIAWATVCAVGILGIILIIQPSEPFQGCIHGNKNAAEYQKLHEPVATITQFYLRSRLVVSCAANFTDKNERTIGALAAIALAVFTLYLWRATQGLRRYAGIQARDMRDLLTAARDNADAAAAQERALREQAKSMAALANIAEKSLVELEAPYVYVNVTEPGLSVGAEISQSHGQLIYERIKGQHLPRPRQIKFAPELKYRFANYGRTPATVTEVFTDINVTAEGLLPPSFDPTHIGGQKLPHGVIVPAHDAAAREYPMNLKPFLLDEYGGSKYVTNNNYLFFFWVREVYRHFR